MRSAIVLIVLLAGCQTEGTAPADEDVTKDSGSLLGIVVDQAVRPVAGATVEATHPGVAAQTSTDADGRFAFHDLDPGIYGLTVQAPGYVDAAATAVVADVGEPELVTVSLQQQRSTEPFAQAIHWQGILGCGTSGSNLCSAPEQATGQDLIPEDSARLFYDEVVGQGLVPDFIQAEVLWKPNVAAFDDLNLLLGSSTPSSWERFEYENRYDTFIGPSPIVGHLNATILAEDAIGVERGLVLELYGGGYDVNSLGVAVDQDFEAFIHLFYYYAPPEGWQFSISGEPSPP